MTHSKGEKKKKKRYLVRNWSAYNAALIKRGSIDVWLDEETIDSWRAMPSGQPGCPQRYSNTAILCTLTFRSVFRLPLRATEGFLTSLFRQTKVPLPIPDFSTLSRRGQFLHVALRKSDRQKTVIIVDSTGVKVYGEGEWKVRQHGVSKRRTWKKIHIAIDENGEIRATDVTGNDTHDSEAVPSLLAQEEAMIETYAGDDASDKRRVYDALIARAVATILVPPQQNAKIWRHGNRNGTEHPRDRNLREIRTHGRRSWKERSGYHIRSRVETTMFRFKTAFGDRVLAREWSRQVSELTLKCAILNRMLHLGMPESYPVA